MRYLIVCVAVITLSGCAETVSLPAHGIVQSVGFWYGLWHGIIAPVAWIVSLFSESTAIYAVYNNGGWYDFGFILGIGALTSSTTV